MTLRLKLVCALMLAALLPMGVAVGVAMLRAERRAEQEAERRLESVRRLAIVLIERYKNDTRSRVERAAADLVANSSAVDSLLAALSKPDSSATARSLAERHGLDHVEVLGVDEAVLSSSRGDEGFGLASALGDVSEDSIELRPLSFGETPGESRGEASRQPRPIAFYTRRSVKLAQATLSLVGARAVGRELVATIADVSGEPAFLLDGTGALAESAGEVVSPQPEARISADTPLVTSRQSVGDEWRIRVSVPTGDVEGVRRDLLGTLAGIAPFAIASALAVGVILAEGISRPIRGLAARAEEISGERAGRLLPLLVERNEVRRLTLCFDRMLEALSDSERQRLGAERIAAWQEVAQRIAHEVKNPLSPIKLAVENLRRIREKAPGELDRALREETTTILEEVESLRRLVDEFSQFVRLPRPRLVPCDLREIVSQTLALFAPRLEAAGVRVEADTAGAPGPAIADPEQIGRALKNVVANAIDALEPMADRRLRIAVKPERGPRGPVARIEVEDSGAGFGPESLRRVFEPYFTTRADRGGTGLGMAIAYRIVTDHGGTIGAAGAPGRGATITIRLPLDGPSDAASS